MSFILLLGLMATGIFVFLFSLFAFESIEKFTVGNAKWVSERLDVMFITISPKIMFQILMISPFVVGLGIFFLFWPHLVFSILFGLATIVLGFRLPKPLIESLLRKRAQKVNVQMVDALTLMASALRSGLSLTQALQVVADEMPNPLSQEFNLILSEHRVGVPLEKSFQNFAERMNNDDSEMFVSSVVVLRETGGNLAETFETIVHTIRERIKLENKIAALTTQGVLQGTIVTLIPFGLMILLSLIDSSHMAPLFTTLPGYIMLGLMLTLQILGGLTIKKIVTIKV